MKNSKLKLVQETLSKPDKISFTMLRNDIEIIYSTLNSLSDGLIITNKEGKFIFFNPVATKILGIGLKDVSP